MARPSPSHERDELVHDDDGVVDRLQREASSASSKAEEAAPYEKAGRAGYAAKGAVYVLIGVLALVAAFGPGGGGQTAGSSEALQVVKQSTFGDILLGLLALGLVGYVLWRLTQAFIDPENVGDEDWGWAKRALYFVSAAAYGLLTYSAIQLLLGNGGGSGSGSGGDSTQSMTQQLLEQPFGPWLVGIVAAGIALRGITQAVKAYKADFFDDIRPVGRLSRDAVRRIGQVGLTARGAVFLMVAGFLVWAALDENSRRARGLEGTLDTLAGMSGGPWLLGAAGAGLVAYGVFQFIKARYRVFG